MTTTKPQSTTEPELKPCRCGRRALLERFHDGDDPQPLFVATCEVCPVKTYDQFTAEEAARVWNEFVSATVNIPDGHWQHVQIKAGNPRVVAIQFETAEQATAFINSFAASPASAAPVVDEEPVPPQEPTLADLAYEAAAFLNESVHMVTERDKQKAQQIAFALRTTISAGNKSDFAYADGYNDGFRQGKQSRAAAATAAPVEQSDMISDCEPGNEQ